ncbi:MAG: MerR family transcriptional regulator [Bifidobacterium subtile]|jgi:DNA-binding transcriptional MerR regulator|nr:MerR family transcriptional regulator [Bifidobacterium subtile]MCI1241206.1 MerR family transcriptional regulator [Bifidobacterium subtile]MCI1258259.1 MerR family transcriptional regulator [Bifidobacterium subtile]
MKHSAHDVSKLAGISTRTLRHYDAIGLLPPSSVGVNKYRFYDDAALVRLQRILLLRELGFGLRQIATILDHQSDVAAAMKTHVQLLRREQQRLTEQIAAVERTLASVQQGGTLMTDTMFAGFDRHADYKDEVERRWGKDAYQRSDEWWNALNDTEKGDWKQQLASLNQGWIAAAQDPKIAPDSELAQDLARRHIAWLHSIPGTPAHDSTQDGVERDYVRGLAQMYVCDERFAANYGGIEGAKFVRDSLLTYLGD